MMSNSTPHVNDYNKIIMIMWSIISTKKNVSKKHGIVWVDKI